MAWPFAEPDILPTIDTSVEYPPWHVAGHWKTPPPEVCDLLTAANFELKFVFNNELFNARYGTMMPPVGSFSDTGNSGMWKDTQNFVSTIFNEDNKWDTQRKVFEGFIEPDGRPYYIFGSLKGFRFYYTADVLHDGGVLDRQYILDLVMSVQKPFPAKDQDGEFIWTVQYPFRAQVTEYVYPGADEGEPSGPPSIYYYPLYDVGSRYLGKDHLGPQGTGGGGCFPVAEISILSHFTP
jgi:hypothetical protein